MTLHSITLMEAYIIENLRKNGVTDKDIIHINEQKTSDWKALDDRFDYTLLKKLADQTGNEFSSIINKGYSVKFLTLNGLINLIQLKTGKKRDTDFIVHDDGISSLVVDSDERKVVEQILSSNWEVTETEEGLSIRG